jgi:hypothetical protein
MREWLSHLVTEILPEVAIAADVGAPLIKRPVGRQRKNRMKG